MYCMKELFHGLPPFFSSKEPSKPVANWNQVRCVFSIIFFLGSVYIPNVLVLSSRSGGDFNRFTVVSDMVEREGL